MSAKKEHKNQRDLAEVRDRDLVIEDLRSEIDELNRQIDSSKSVVISNCDSRVKNGI